MKIDTKQVFPLVSHKCINYQIPVRHGSGDFGSGVQRAFNELARLHVRFRPNTGVALSREDNIEEDVEIWPETV